MVQNGTREFLKDSWIFPDLLSDRKLTNPEIRQRYKQLGISIAEPTEVALINHAVTFRRIRGVIVSTQKYKLQMTGGRWLTPDDMRHHHTSSITQKVLQKIVAQR
jgi:hypothetical protein